MTQEKRHELAENFRQQIEWPAQRAEAIRSILAKSSFDESDKLRIKILLSKLSYAQGCDQEYVNLINRIYYDAEWHKDAKSFYRRWTAK